MTPGRVAAIVVTYNRSKLLVEAVDALLHLTDENYDIFIINNGSTDDTESVVMAMLPNEKIKYYNTGNNLGGAGGFHFGIRTAFPMRYDYFWLMDDDSIAEKDALSNLRKAASQLDGRFGFICSNVRWIDGRPCKMNIPIIDKTWMDNTDLIQVGIIPVKTATFVGFFISKTVVENIGLPIKEFFIWSDDTNYSLRAKRVEQCYCALNSIIVHKMQKNTSSDIVTDDSGRESRYFYSFRNKLYNARYEKEVGRYIKDLLLQTIKIILRSKHKGRKLYYMYKGFFAGIFFRPIPENVKSL